MPRSRPFRKIEELLAFEQRVRAGQKVDPDAELGDPYWSDIGRLVQISFAGQDDEAIKEISDRMHDNIYHSAIEDQRDRIAQQVRKAEEKVHAEGGQ